MVTGQVPEPGAIRPYLSIIIPAYNEEPRIAGTLREVVDYLSTRPYTWEVAVVDDGSADATASLVKTFSEACPQVHLISVPPRWQRMGGKSRYVMDEGRLPLFMRRRPFYAD